MWYFNQHIAIGRIGEHIRKQIEPNINGGTLFSKPSKLLTWENYRPPVPRWWRPIERLLLAMTFGGPAVASLVWAVMLYLSRRELFSDIEFAATTVLLFFDLLLVVLYVYALVVITKSRERILLPVSVQVLQHYLIEVTFTDGGRGRVDVSSEIHGSEIEALHDPTFFAKVRVDAEVGKVVWPNGAYLNPELLYAVARGPARSAPKESWGNPGI